MNKNEIAWKLREHENWVKNGGKACEKRGKTKELVKMIEMKDQIKVENDGIRV